MGRCRRRREEFHGGNRAMVRECTARERNRRSWRPQSKRTTVRDRPPSPVQRTSEASFIHGPRVATQAVRDRATASGATGSWCGRTTGCSPPHIAKQGGHVGIGPAGAKNSHPPPTTQSGATQQGSVRAEG